MSQSQYDIIIVGGASAGLAAALYAGRQALKTLVITKDIGGQALLTNDIQNYPGVPEIGGFELMTKFQEQATAYGAEFYYDEVVGIEMAEESCFKVKTINSEFYSCALILALGKTPRDLGVPGEQELKGKGVSYCAVCDGPLFRGKKVGVVGVGDPALEAANYLAGVVGQVNIIQRTPHPIGDEDLIRNLSSRPNVKLLGGKVVSSINGKTMVESLTLKDESRKNEAMEDLKVDGVFIEMGYVTRTRFLEGLVKLNTQGEIVADKDGKTSTPGVFAAGDVTDIQFKQAVISAGQGAAAALSAYNYIQRLRGEPASKADWKSITPKKAFN